MGAKRFQAALVDPYAEPNLELYSDMDVCLRVLTWALLTDYTSISPIANFVSESTIQVSVMEGLLKSLVYLRQRIGVPRDMSYPAARQFRAHITWLMEKQLYPLANKI